MAKFTLFCMLMIVNVASPLHGSATDNDLLQEDLNNIYEWSLSSKLMFSLKKSSLVTFCSAHHTPLDFYLSLKWLVYPYDLFCS